MAVLSAREVYALARKGGFSPVEAVIMTAVAGFRGSPDPGESHGNTQAHNYNLSTGDDSWGIWQINMLGSLGPTRRAQFGIKSNEELLDPVTNAKAAYRIFKQQGYSAWGAYKRGGYKDNLSGAASGAKGVESPGIIDNILSGIARFTRDPIGSITGTAADIATEPIERALEEGTNQLKRAGFMLVFGAAGLGLMVLGAQQMVTPTIRRAIGI